MSAPDAKVRTFLAVEVAAEIHAALVALQRELARADAAVRWVRDEGLHATVKFLGGVPETRLPALRDALRDALAATPPMRAAVRGLGVFPHARRPRVVWAGLDCPPLTRLAAAVDDALAPLAFAKEVRPFHPHLTLGRVTGPRGWERLNALLAAQQTAELGACDLAELIAYRSDLRRDGAVYTKLWTIPFGG